MLRIGGVLFVYSLLFKKSDKNSFSWSSEQRVELAPREIHFDWSNSVLLEADVIVGYCSVEVLAQ